MLKVIKDIKTRLRATQLTANFRGLGFRRFVAFYNVIRSYDTTIKKEVLQRVWNGRECTNITESKLLTVLQNLRNE